MAIDDKIIDEKLQYDINREAAKISALSSSKIDKYEYLTGEEILPFDQTRIIQEAKFTYSPLRKAFEKQIKTIEGRGKKQVEALETSKPGVNKQDKNFIDGIFPKKMRTYEMKNETYEIKKWGEEIKRKNLKQFILKKPV